MAKRTRGSSRPGQRRAAQHAPARTAPRPPVRRSDGLSAEEEARAAELEAQIVAQERAAEQPRIRARDRDRDRDRERDDAADRSVRRATGQSLLAVKAAEEYAYVVRDVRRIVTVAGAMFVAMAVLYVLIQVFHVVKVG